MAHIESGVLRTKGQVTTGTSKEGKAWKRQDILLEREFHNSVRNIFFSAFNDVVDTLSGIREGDSVDVTFFPISREYKGKWYTELRVAEVRKKGVEVKKEEATPAPAPEATPTESESLDPQEGDLPF